MKFLLIPAAGILALSAPALAQSCNTAAWQQAQNACVTVTGSAKSQCIDGAYYNATNWDTSGIIACKQSTLNSALEGLGKIFAGMQQ